MTNREFFKKCLGQEVSWLADCASNPGAYMRPIHIALVKLAIRKLTTRPRVPYNDISTITEYGMSQKLSHAVRVF